MAGGYGATQFTDTYWIDQGAGKDLVTGQQGTLARTSAFTLNGSGTLIKAEGINRGHVTGITVNKNMSDGTHRFDSGTDEGEEQGNWPILTCMRNPTLVPPASISFTGSYFLETGVGLRNGKSGSRLVHVAGADFASMYGETDFMVRMIGWTLPNAANNRYIAVEGAYDNAGDSTLEFVVGYQNGPAPAGPVVTNYGNPLASATEVVTVQVGITVDAGEAPLRCFSFYQKQGPFGMPRYHAANTAVPGDMTLTIDPTKNIFYNVTWNGAGATENSQLDLAQAPAGGDYDNGAILVNGVVAAGALTLDMDAGLAAGTIAVGDTFTVAGATGVYTFDAVQLAAGGIITGATFTPAAQEGGFANDAALAIEGGLPFAPDFIAPVGLSTGTGDGNAGGLKILGFVSHGSLAGGSEEAVHFDCSALGGVSGSVMTLTSNNQRDDGDICTEPKNTTPGTMTFTASVDLKLTEDATKNRPRLLTSMGIKASAQAARMDYVWEHSLEAGQTEPSAVSWHFPSAQVTAFTFAGGDADTPLTGTIPVEMAQKSNSEGELAKEARWTFFPPV